MRWLHPENARRSGPLAIGLITALAIGAWLLTGEDDAGSGASSGHRYLAMGTEGEKVLGAAVAPILAARHGGLSEDQQASDRLERIGNELVFGTVASTTLYDFDVELLADSETPAVYALPGGRILVTAAMEDMLDDDEELAAVIAEQIALIMHSAPTHALADKGLLDALPSTATLEAFDLEAADDDQRAALVAVADSLEHVRYPSERELRAEQTALEVLDQSRFDVHALERAARTLGEQPRRLGMHFDLSERLQLIEEAFAAHESQSS